MSISFNSVPTAWRVPLFYAEFDNSRAVQGSATQEYKTLLIGNKLSTGTKDELTLWQITSAEQAAEYFGAGSVLANQVAAFLAVNRIHKLYCIAIDDLSAGVKATAKITFGGTATASGIVSFMIGGRNYQVAVAATDTDDDVSAALVAEIQADTLRMVDAAVDGTDANETNLTARHKGEFGNDIDIQHSYFDGEALPAGITASIAAMASGAGNPDVDEVWPVLGDEQFILVSTPYTDATNLGKVEDELDDRFGPIRQNDGYAIYGARGTHGTLTTLGESRNSLYTTIIGANGSPSNPWEWGAMLAGQVANSASIDPARPFQTLPLTDIYAPKLANRFTKEERNQLLFSGICTFDVATGDNVLIEGVITTYRLNAFDAADTSYLYLNSPLTLSFLRFDLKARISSRFPRHKLANDGTRFAPGQAVATPNVIKAEVISKFREWEENGLVEGFDQFKSELIVERNSDNPNRIDILMPPDLVNQLVMVATKIQFLL